MGRKPDQDVARSEIWRIRATEAESAELDRQCEAAGVDRSRYIRGLVGAVAASEFGDRPPSAWDWFNGRSEPIAASEHGPAPVLLLNREGGSVVVGGNAPDFDGETYDRERDHTRLASALERVKAILSDGQWHSIAEVADRANISPAATSARFRDLRKAKFGGHTVERENLGGGFWRYRLVLS